MAKPAHYTYSAELYDDRERTLRRRLADAFAITATAISIPVLYPVKKAFNSLTHLARGNKKTRSLFRLGSIGGGAYGGVVLGGFIGSLIFPGVGTIIGSVVGGILGAGAAAVAAKHISRGFSYLFNRKSSGSTVFAPTNPARYNIPSTVPNLKARTHPEYLLSTTDAFGELKNQKKALGLLRKVPFTSAHRENYRYNRIIKDIQRNRVGYLALDDTEDGISFWKSHSDLAQLRELSLPADESLQQPYSKSTTMTALDHIKALIPTM